MSSVSGTLWAMELAFRQQWREASKVSFATFFITPLPMSLVLAWIATRAGNETAATFVVFGVFLVASSQAAVFNIGWLLSSELQNGTLQHTIVSPCPLVTVLFAKGLAVMAAGSLTGIVSLLAAAVIARDLIHFAHPAMLAVCFVLWIPVLVCLGFIWAPLFLLVGTRPGFFNAILPAIAVFGGFTAPVSHLPYGLQLVAHLLPGAYLLLGVVERRIRVTAALAMG
jgi:hypothetical protein